MSFCISFLIPTFQQNMKIEKFAVFKKKGKVNGCFKCIN